MYQVWCKNFESQRILYLFTLSLEQQTFDDNAFLDDIYSRGYHTLGLLLGSIFGSIFGFIFLILAIVITLILVIGVCACNHRCPLYKWRHRREHSPLGLIIADGNNEIKEENSIGMRIVVKFSFFHLKAFSFATENVACTVL